MQEQLLLPAEVRGTQSAKDAGLGAESVQLLPSFLHLLRAPSELSCSFFHPRSIMIGCLRFRCMRSDTRQCFDKES